jgi:DEAD/DEAH box helicase domain-containing protein
MPLADVLSSLRLNRDFMKQVVAWEKITSRPAQFQELATVIDPRITRSLSDRGVNQFYSHQAEAISAVQSGQHVVVATATASGKSLCYSVPVLTHMLADPASRALFLFPTKALAHDQLAETKTLIAKGELPLTVNAFDGDTPRSQRQAIRRSEGILISNPDMLHAGILPYHTSWRALFSSLRFVVLDEIHVYRGIFGSHVANVIRRLRRICNFYGSDPIFICCSATVANPKDHAEKLVEVPFFLVDDSQNGAPSGKKDFLLYNPPIVNQDLGLRHSTVLTAKEIATEFLVKNIQTVVFARARQTVELLLAYLRDELIEDETKAATIVGYRGGYLPLERRRIEKGLRNGSVRGVVATNALELGIDIGQLTVAILTGYPGSVASTWQQAGRAGRRTERSVVVLVAGASPLDQYICQHPRFLFGRSPEHALCNPDNQRILTRHLACAAYELPFQQGEAYGRLGNVDDILDSLSEAGSLHLTNERYHWLGTNIPVNTISLRTSGDETVVIQDVSGNSPVVIGEIDLDSVPILTYEGAIYMHQAKTYLVETLDWEARLAQVRPVEVDYYTRSSVGSSIRHMAANQKTTENDLLTAHGEVLVVTKATGFRKIKRYTHETLGFGDIDLPERELDTDGFWFVFGEELTGQLVSEGILVQPNDYGPNWQDQRLLALERDKYRCRTCGAEARPGKGLHVHHLRPFREYRFMPGTNTAYIQANDLDNLVTLCPSCHRRAEAGQQTRSALGGLAYLLGNLAPLFLMCDPQDIQVSAENRSPITQLPTVVVYERIAAGVGFSERLFELRQELIYSALEMVTDCGCRDGCPACVGPPGDIGPDTKTVTQQLLKILTRLQAD